MTRVAVSETQFHGFPIHVEVNLDGSGISEISTGIGFFDHMLELFAKHGQFDLNVQCKGDLHVDDHHVVDEVAMNIGLCLQDATYNNASQINRYGFYVLPMDEALTTCAVDFCRRSSFVFDVRFAGDGLRGMNSNMVREFWSLVAQKSMVNFILKSEFGANDHHISEGVFKCAARALSMAVQLKGESK